MRKTILLFLTLGIVLAAIPAAGSTFVATTPPDLPGSMQALAYIATANADGTFDTGHVTASIVGIVSQVKIVHNGVADPDSAYGAELLDTYGIDAMGTALNSLDGTGAGGNYKPLVEGSPATVLVHGVLEFSCTGASTNGAVILIIIYYYEL